MTLYPLYRNMEAGEAEQLHVDIAKFIHSRESQLFKEVEEKVIGDMEIESIFEPLSPDDYMTHGANEKIQEQTKGLAQLRKEWGE